MSPHEEVDAASSEESLKEGQWRGGSEGGVAEVTVAEASDGLWGRGVGPAAFPMHHAPVTGPWRAPSHRV